MTKNIFVLGMTDLQRDELATLRGAADYRFHGLLDYERLVGESDYDLDALLEQARRQLAQFPDTIDAIVCHWDFPSSIIGPILSAERDLPAPSLKSLLACEHKYWSRLAQREAVPEVVPAFCAFDPFAEDVRAQIELDFPFWVKPVKAHSSALGFAIHDEEELTEAVRQIRDEISDVGDAFDQALARVEVPDEVGDVGGNSCLAEQIVTGIQAAPEGTVFRGVFRDHGLIDMHKNEDGTSISRIDYPGVSVPDEVQAQMVDVARRYLEHVGFDNGAFNAEFMWDPDADKLWMIEVNTRISQSHSELFILVDGASNHEVVIDIALGREPSMPRGEGPYAVAAKAAIFHDTDGVVRRVPSQEDKDAVAERFPGTRVTLVVAEGDRLSELPHQDAYSYLWGNVYLGAQDRDELEQRYDQIVSMLPIEIEPAP